MSAASTPRRKPRYPGSLTDLHRFRKTVHGHDGSSRIVMVRKTDQRTFASREKGQEPKLETITRETIETFRGQRTECKITTEKKDIEDTNFPEYIEKSKRVPVNSSKLKTIQKRRTPAMEFQNECLKVHNEYRRKHGVPPLKLDKSICNVAQDWANHLIKTKAFQHSGNQKYGENLYCSYSSDPNVNIIGNEPVDSWYDEIKLHQFGVEPNSLDSGHFTQVIWKESTHLGVAYAKSGGKIVVVANYYPPGNMIGDFAKNVPPMGGFSGNDFNNHQNSNHNNNNIDDGDDGIVYHMGHLSMSVPKTSHKDSKKFTEGKFEEDFLTAHNQYRIKHGVPPLKLDKKLCKYSEEWAKHLASKNQLEHRPSCNYGENIYAVSCSDPNFKINGNSPVDAWYDEIQYHPFGKEPNNLKSGHFTQVIWKSSEYLGVGTAKSNQGSIFVVANYSPAGNFVGHYVENVLPLSKDYINNKSNSDSPNAASLQSTPSITRRKLEDDFPQFAIDGLKIHNEYRRKHGVPELKLSKQLQKYAQEWADTCAKSGSMATRVNNPYGENIFCVYSSDYSHVPTPRDAIKEWYDEIKKHTYGIEKVNHGSLHFTQVIWKNTTELGFAMAKNHKGETYVVANYNPRGNCIGQFVPNVPRPKF